MGEAGFDVEVHVFEVELPLELARFNLGPNLRHAFFNGGLVVFADDALVAQHLGVGQAARDVGLPQALVKEHAGGVALDQLAHGFRKQGGPRLGFFVELVCHMSQILSGWRGLPA